MKSNNRTSGPIWQVAAWELTKVWSLLAIFSGTIVLLLVFSILLARKPIRRVEKPMRRIENKFKNTKIQNTK